MRKTFRLLFIVESSLFVREISPSSCSTLVMRLASCQCQSFHCSPLTSLRKSRRAGIFFFPWSFFRVHWRTSERDAGVFSTLSRGFNFLGVDDKVITLPVKIMDSSTFYVTGSNIEMSLPGIFASTRCFYSNNSLRIVF